MTTRVSTPQTVSINNESYRLAEDTRVHRRLSSQYPQKVVFGDVDKDSNPRSSVIIWDDFTDGVGLYVTDGREGLKRSQWSSLDTQYKGHLILPPEDFQAADPGVTGSVDEINELAGILYLALVGGTDAYSWTPSDDTWSSKLHDFPAQVTDSLHFTLAGTAYVAFAHTGGFTYTSDGSTWTDDTTDALHLAFWDDRLWGIDNAGQLWFSTTIGTEVNDAQLPLPAGYVNGLFTGPDAQGNEILYAATEVGLYAHDAANSRFVRTGVQFPQNTTAGKAATAWNGEIYISPGGMAVYRYNPLRGVFLSVGLDRDAGLPSNFRGDIERLIPVHNGLLAVQVDATSDSIWLYNGRGWHFINQEGADIESAHASDVNGTYRIYYARLNRLRYRELRTGFVNPDEDTITYDQITATRHLITPWFNAGQNEIDKTAIRCRIDCTDMDSNHTVQVHYRLDYGSSYESTSFTVTSNGVTTRTFPNLGNSNSEAGSAFRAIQFRFILSSSVTNTQSPNVKSFSLEWRRKIPAKWAFTIDIDHRENIENRTPETQLDDLRTAIESSTLVELSYRDREDNAENYYVDILNAEIIEETGNEFEGVTRLTAVEM